MVTLRDRDMERVKRKALVKVFNRHARLLDGTRVLLEHDLGNALGELGFFSLYSNSQSEVLLRKLVVAMGGVPVALDSFVLVMSSNTNARKVDRVESSTPPQPHSTAAPTPTQFHSPSPPPPPPPPRPPSPSRNTHPPIFDTHRSPSRSPSPDWKHPCRSKICTEAREPGDVAAVLDDMSDALVHRMHSASEERHGQRLAIKLAAEMAASGLTQEDRAVSFEPVREHVIPFSKPDESLSIPDGWVQRAVPEKLPPKPMLAVAAVATQHRTEVSPLTHLPLLSFDDLSEEAQSALSTVGGGWAKGTMPAVHATLPCVGDRVLLVGDSVVHLLHSSGTVEHCLPLANISGIYTTERNLVGLECRSARGVAFTGRDPVSERFLKTILEAASARQGAIDLSISFIDSAAELTALVREDLLPSSDLPVTFYVPESDKIPEKKQDAKDVEWLGSLKSAGKTGFVVDATWEDRRYRISVAEGALGSVKVGTIKATMSRWVSLPVASLCLHSPKGELLEDDTTTGKKLHLQPGDVFQLHQAVVSPVLSVTPSPERNGAQPPLHDTQEVPLSPEADGVAGLMAALGDIEANPAEPPIEPTPLGVPIRPLAVPAVGRARVPEEKVGVEQLEPQTLDTQTVAALCLPADGAPNAPQPVVMTSGVTTSSLPSEVPASEVNSLLGTPDMVPTALFREQRQPPPHNIEQPVLSNQEIAQSNRYHQPVQPYAPQSTRSGSATPIWDAGGGGGGATVPMQAHLPPRVNASRSATPVGVQERQTLDQQFSAHQPPRYHTPLEGVDEWARYRRPKEQIPEAPRRMYTPASAPSDVMYNTAPEREVHAQPTQPIQPMPQSVPSYSMPREPVHRPSLTPCDPTPYAPGGYAKQNLFPTSSRSSSPMGNVLADVQTRPPLQAQASLATLGASTITHIHHREDEGRSEWLQSQRRYDSMSVPASTPNESPGVLYAQSTPTQQASISMLKRVGAKAQPPQPSPVGVSPVTVAPSYAAAGDDCVDGSAPSVTKQPPQLAPSVGVGMKMQQGRRVPYQTRSPVGTLQQRQQMQQTQHQRHFASSPVQGGGGGGGVGAGVGGGGGGGGFSIAASVSNRLMV